MTLAYAMGFILPSIWWLSPQYVAPAAMVALAPAVACVDAGLSAVFAAVTQGGRPPLLGSLIQYLPFNSLKGLLSEHLAQNNLRHYIPLCFEHVICFCPGCIQSFDALVPLVQEGIEKGRFFFPFTYLSHGIRRRGLLQQRGCSSRNQCPD